jgi:hypothetical protein
MRLIASVLCPLLLVGCGAWVEESNSQDPPIQQDAAVADDLRIEWQFSPSLEERQLLRRAVYSLAERDHGLDLSAVIVAYRLDAQYPRYLVVTRSRIDADAREITLYAIAPESEGLHLSEAWSAAPDLLFGFAILELTDQDRDGGTDIVYCVWRDDEQDPGQQKVLGYRNHAWYVIDERAGCD